ncbi:hypothetical protein LIER_18109 [Lithospermum erythrorhizon]|uniref:Uncharacterized protein n=1 Tax=Lithospermum erythrorhizon TaxID=34254 RepID=A0AAV3QFK8_LITER
MARSRFPGPLDTLLAIGSGRRIFLVDVVMKAFCEYWSPSTNTLLTDSELPRVYVSPQAVNNGKGKASSLAGCPNGTVPSHRD